MGVRDSRPIAEGPVCKAEAVLFDEMSRARAALWSCATAAERVAALQELQRRAAKWEYALLGQAAIEAEAAGMEVL